MDQTDDNDQSHNKLFSHGISRNPYMLSRFIIYTDGKKELLAFGANRD